MNLPIYLDYAATTPIDPKVLEVMLPYFTTHFGNAGSGTHAFGLQAKASVEKARKTIAAKIGAEESEIIFTSGATESINLGIKGVFELYQQKGKHIITCETEHKAVLDTLEFLKSKGAEITYLKVNSQGQISLEDLEKSIRPDTILISLMMVNNETGVVFPTEKIGEIALQRNVVFLSDATQAIGKIDIDVKKDKIGLLPLSAHKIYGPKGIGALYISRKNPRVSLLPLIHGGGQEKNLRAGTLNVSGIAGFEKAVELLDDVSENKRLDDFKNQLTHFFIQKGAKINGDLSNSVPNILNIQIPGISARELIKKNPNLAFSLGSACASENLNPSHVLKAMGLSDSEIKSSFRLSMGRFTTQEEIDTVVKSFL